jgi:hypothetical protein
MTAKDLLKKLDSIQGTWADYDKEAIPLVEQFRAEARAEALKDAADRAVKFCHDIFPWGSDGSHAENLRAAITQEEEK